MDNSRIPDLLQICQNDFNKTLYGVEKFVKEVLNGRNSCEKLKISEKILKQVEYKSARRMNIFFGR